MKVPQLIPRNAICVRPWGFCGSWCEHDSPLVDDMFHWCLWWFMANDSIIKYHKYDHKPVVYDGLWWFVLDVTVDTTPEMADDQVNSSGSWKLDSRHVPWSRLGFSLSIVGDGHQSITWWWNCCHRKATSNKRWGCPNSVREPKCWRVAGFTRIYSTFSWILSKFCRFSPRLLDIDRISPFLPFSDPHVC